jgi:hypothetical protein
MSLGPVAEVAGRLFEHGAERVRVPWRRRPRRRGHVLGNRSPQSIAGSQLDISRALDKVWWLTIAAGILMVMARGFKWL